MLRRHRAGRRQVCVWTGAILANDLLESSLEDLPGEDLDVLLDVAWLRVREPHNELEELLTISLGL